MPLSSPRPCLPGPSRWGFGSRARPWEFQVSGAAAGQKRPRQPLRSDGGPSPLPTPTAALVGGSGAPRGRAQSGPVPPAVRPRAGGFVLACVVRCLCPKPCTTELPTAAKAPAVAAAQARPTAAACGKHSGLCPCCSVWPPGQQPLDAEGPPGVHGRAAQALPAPKDAALRPGPGTAATGPQEPRAAHRLGARGMADPSMLLWVRGPSVSTPQAWGPAW